MYFTVGLFSVVAAKRGVTRHVFLRKPSWSDFSPLRTALILIETIQKGVFHQQCQQSWPKFNRSSECWSYNHNIFQEFHDQMSPNISPWHKSDGQKFHSKRGLHPANRGCEQASWLQHENLEGLTGMGTLWWTYKKLLNMAIYSGFSH